MLNLKKTFDLQKDVFSHILRNDNSTGKAKAETNGRIHNVERDGGVLYSWKETPGTTRIGKYDLNTKEHKLLYVFDEDVLVSSCSVNKEETLLAVSLSQRSKKEGHLRPVPKFLTLLIEIQPINNTKVLKAVDCTVRVQFLYPEPGKRLVTESHLLLIVEDGYVEQFHIPLTKLEGYRVVIQNPERLAKDRIAEELSWVQWDGETQRLFYITSRERPIVKCLQFYPDCNCETVFELPVDLATNPFASARFVNLGYDYYKDGKVEDEGLNLVVLTSKTGSMCICYSQHLCANEDITYTIAFVHRGYSRTYTVARAEGFTCSSRILFFQLGYYIVVYLADCFLHLINARQQDLPCYSLFLSGAGASLGPLSPGCLVLTFPWATFLDPHMGRMYWADLSSPVLLQLLRQPGPDAQRLAALHCLLGHMGPDPDMERQVVDWICESVMPLESFDQIQEFMLASLYRTIYQQSPSLDNVEVLPYSSLFEKKELSDGLKLIPGVRFTSDLLPPPLFRGKAQNLRGYWEELQWNAERMKYFEAVPNPRFRTSAMRAEWTRLQAELRLEGKKSSRPLRNIEENTKKVLSVVDTWQLDKKVVPLFHNEDHQQRALIGLMVDKLREHMNRHLPRLGKKKIERLVVSYVTNLLKLVRHLLEALWGKYKLELGVLSVAQQGSASEWAVFHMMTRILEATAGLCLPLPPGYHTLLSVLGMRCLPRYTFMQYVDHGLLQLTEPFVSRLMTDLDNSPDNEGLKFSIMKRLPEPMEQKTCQLWDHPITSASISRGYVKELLEKRKTKGTTSLDSEKSSCSPEFLPLTYLVKILSDVESQVLNPFEGQENVDARFVEETALKQTMILLGLEDK
ncbi:gamma-secretase-activating protein isoform X2 [Brienomyrus brachyistius]|uniref:gamma-secretase-activating protein isoform X2 n=1 Tax=Brienomyrus brachyistius TaxID=42636 RepID=UPI0020B3683A|nr:gamma-secretase-activating protein isoform X2 [Brienomyrus brachyistius]